MGVLRIHDYRVVCDHQGSNCLNFRSVVGTSIWAATRELIDDGWTINQEPVHYVLGVTCPPCGAELAEKGITFTPKSDVSVVE